jgi:hypothetical protein
MTFQQVMAAFRKNTLTHDQLASWLQSGTATDAQVHQFQQAVLHSVLTSDNKGSWISQIERDFKHAPGAALGDVGISNPITDVTHFLTSSSTWVRGGEILAGAILLIAGVMAILNVRPSTSNLAKKVALL